MIIVMGHCRTASGEFDRVTEAMQAQVAATNAEDGCIHYSFGRHVSDPDLLIISERWRDQAAIDAHFKSPHMAAFNAVLGASKVLEIDVKSYDLATGEVKQLIGG